MTSITLFLTLLGQVVGILAVASLAVNLLVELGLLRVLAEKLTRVSREQLSLVLLFLICAVSPSAAYATLLAVKERSGLRSEQLYPVLILLSPLTHMSEVLRLVLPLSLTLFGLGVGLLYTCIALGRAMLRLVIHFTLSRLRYSSELKLAVRELSHYLFSQHNSTSTDTRTAIQRALLLTARLLRRVLPRLLIAMAIVAVLMYTGLMQVMADFVNPFLNQFGLTHAMVLVVTTQIIHYIAGLYTAASLFAERQLTVKDLLTALLIGTVISSPLTQLRAYLPVRAALFGFRVAFRWTLLDVFSSVLTSIVALILVQILL